MNGRLYRSPDDRVLAGVAGGMAEAWDLDPALVRVGWALLAIISGGVFLLIYIVMALVVPLRPAYMPLWAMANAGGGMATGDPAPGGGAGPAGPTQSSFEGGPGAAPPPGYRGPGQPHRRTDATGALVLGILLILAGGYFLLRQFMPALDLGLLWPVVVIGFGAFLIVAAFARRERVR
jgi:phage shock protein C